MLFRWRFADMKKDKFAFQHGFGGVMEILMLGAQIRRFIKTWRQQFIENLV